MNRTILYIAFMILGTGHAFASAPVITMQPSNVSVTVPDPATFIIAATGDPAPSYQWQIGVRLGRFIQFQNIPGATSDTYTISPTSEADNATIYDCVVSNSDGSVTSNPASLSINPPGSAIVSPVNQSVITSASLIITAIPSSILSEDITGVDFYAGPTYLGTVSGTSSVYSFAWTNILPGTYVLTTVTNYIFGAQSTSPPVNVVINAPAFTYSIDDNLASKTDARGNTTSYQYDKDNRLLQTTFADGSTVAEGYDLFGNQTSITDQRGNTLNKIYDVYDRLYQTKDPLNGITQFNYDTEGRLLTLTDANGHATNYSYDPNGRVLTETNALNFTTSFTYDPAGNVSTRTDANGMVTNYTYDALNRLTNTAYPDDSSIVLGYDAISRKTSMTDTTGLTSYTYDNVNRLLTKTDPGNNTITYTYDSEGNRSTAVDQNNRTITNTYDPLNRLTTVTDPNGTTTYGYDAVSNEILVKSPNGVSENYTYDALNRVLSAVNKTSTTINAPTPVTAPSPSTPAPLPLPVAPSSPSTGTISSYSNVYDIAGMIKSKTFADGSWVFYSYDALNRLTEETKRAGNDTIIYDYVYTYDAVGNRLTWTKNTTLGGFWSIDSLTMPPQVLTDLTNAGYGKTVNPAFSLSLVRIYSYDTANRLNNWNYGINIYNLSFPIETDTYNYDYNGNREAKNKLRTGQVPEKMEYLYDYENRLKELVYKNIPGVAGLQIDYLAYNGEGLRTEVVRNNVPADYLYDGSNILIEKNQSGTTTKTYMRGLDLGGGIASLIAQNTATNASGAQYYQYDDLGSTADLTSSTGASVAIYNYDVFGNLLTPQTSTDTNRYLFSTKEFDSRAGLYYFGARYYDPEIGRWLTPDPTGFIDGINPYLYVHNNPVNDVDPFGLYGLVAPIFGPPLLPPPTNLGGKPNASGGGSTSGSTSEIISFANDSGSSSGSNSSNNKQFDDVANELGMDNETKNDFSDWLHDLKEMSGMGGNDNFGYQELIRLGKEFLETYGM